MKTRYVELDPENPDPDLLKQAAQVLSEGGLIGFPTETVYGIATRFDNAESVSRLRVLKGRSSNKPFTIHLGDVDDMFNYIHEIPPLAMRIMDRFWPGPLTLVLPTSQGEFVGLRWPSHPVAHALLQLCNFPVIAPSINPEGEPPSTNANMIREYFDGKLDMVLDAGENLLKQSSSVIRVSNQSWELLRKGPVDEEDIEKLNYTFILFVCTGNTCRSPMAEAMCKDMLAKHLACTVAELPEKGFVIRSAGTSAFSGGRASPHSLVAMQEMDIDISQHESSMLSLHWIDTADHIYTLSQSHLDTILHWNPFIANRARLLRRGGESVGDPFGGMLEEYRSCAMEIRVEVEAIVDAVLSKKKRK